MKEQLLKKILSPQEVRGWSLYLIDNFDTSTIMHTLLPAYAKAGQPDLVRIAKKAVRDDISDRKLIQHILRSRSSEKFKRLFIEGNWQGYANPWKATWGLCGILIFYTADAEQTDRIFRQSGLFKLVYNRWDGHYKQETTLKSKALNAPSKRLYDYWNHEHNSWTDPLTCGDKVINYLLEHSNSFYGREVV